MIHKYKYIKKFNKFSTDKLLNEEFFHHLPKKVIDELDDEIIIDKESESEMKEYIKNGKLAEYLRENGKIFTFGLLSSLFEDAITLKRNREMVKGGYKMFHRLIPVVGAIFFPIISLAGFILGQTRAVNKIIKPILSDPGNNYPEFLKKIIISAMYVAEGEIKPLLGDDEFYNAFVITDKTMKMVRKDVLRDFAHLLSDKMSKEQKDKEVPKSYIENELKYYLNKRFNISPPIPYENGHIPT